MLHRTVAGTIAYTSRKPERMGQRRGIEHFRFTHHGDGAVTLRAYCELEDPAPTVLRDVIYSIDSAGRPADCLLRLTVGDRFMGSGWIRFTEDGAECESYGPSIGRVSQRVVIEQPLDGFGTHPISADGYLLSRVSLKEGERRSLHVMVPSPDLRGASPPLLTHVHIDAEFTGRETVTVPAGSFPARRYRFLDDGSSGFSCTHPPYELWISDDQDAVFLKGGVGGQMQTWYELASLQR